MLQIKQIFHLSKLRHLIQHMYKIKLVDEFLFLLLQYEEIKYYLVGYTTGPVSLFFLYPMNTFVLTQNIQF